MTDRYEPTLAKLFTLTRSPVHSQEIKWRIGPSLGGGRFMRAVRNGNSVEIHTSHEPTLSMPVDRARLLVKALTNVIEAGDRDGGEGLADQAVEVTRGR